MSNAKFTQAAEQMKAMIEWACAHGIAFVGFTVIDGRVASADHVDCKDIRDADNAVAKRLRLVMQTEAATAVQELLGRTPTTLFATLGPRTRTNKAD